MSLLEEGVRFRSDVHNRAIILKILSPAVSFSECPNYDGMSLDSLCVTSVPYHEEEMLVGTLSVACEDTSEPITLEQSPAPWFLPTTGRSESA